MCSVLDDQDVSYSLLEYEIIVIYVEIIIIVVSYEDRLAEITYFEIAAVVADIRLLNDDAVIILVQIIAE